MWGWLPIVGPIIDGIVSIFNKQADVGLAKQQDSNKTDLGVIQARAQVAIAFKDDIGSRLARDLIMFPTSLWVFLVFWDSMVKNLAPSLTWRIEQVPTSFEYIPYAVIAFLFVTAWKK